MAPWSEGGRELRPGSCWEVFDPTRAPEGGSCQDSWPSLGWGGWICAASGSEGRSWLEEGHTQGDHCRGGAGLGGSSQVQAAQSMAPPPSIARPPSVAPPLPAPGTYRSPAHPTCRGSQGGGRSGTPSRCTPRCGRQTPPQCRHAHPGALQWAGVRATGPPGQPGPAPWGRGDVPLGLQPLGKAPSPWARARGPAQFSADLGPASSWDGKSQPDGWSLPGAPSPLQAHRGPPRAPLTATPPPGTPYAASSRLPRLTQLH